MPSAVNRLHTASENLWISLESAFDTDKVVRVKRCVISLLHGDEMTLPNSDPNHPYRRFGASGDTSGNRSRLRTALRDFASHDSDDESDDEDNSDCMEVIDAMFNSSSTHYSKLTDFLSRYRDYVIAEDGSDSDTDSD